MEGVSEEGDDLFSIMCGDLGLGESTRGTNYLKFGLGQGQTPLSVSDSCLHGDMKYLIVSSEHQNDSRCLHDGQSDYNDHSCSRSHVESTKSRSDAGGSSFNVSVEDFPMYADVPYGTSLRQQKKLFEQQVDKLRKQFAANHTEDPDAKGSRRSSSFKMTGKEIEKKLVVAMQEMDELKIELDACRKRLDAKYKAVAILKEQADLADTELKKSERRASETSRRLEQHGDGKNALVEALEGSSVGQISGEMLELELERVCQENSILMSKLEARNEELRRANAHKSAIARERDELLALLDVTERMKYEQGKSKIAEEEYGSFSSTELAVLGACKCRVSSPEPCGCAHAAANLRKEVAKLREELELTQQRREEANLTVDAYRSAFEEQLNRSKSMSSHLSHIATMSSRTAKAKAAIKWLIQVLNDDDYVPPKPAEQGMDAEKGNQLSNLSLQELVTVLTDMLHEKNEALAHQKLAAQVLANKIHMYEKKHGKTFEDSDQSTNSRPRRHKHKQSRPPQTMSSDMPECDKREINDDTSTFDDEFSPCNTQSRDDVVFKYIVCSGHERDTDELGDGGEEETASNSRLGISNLDGENISKGVVVAAEIAPSLSRDDGENAKAFVSVDREALLDTSEKIQCSDACAAVTDDVSCVQEGAKVEMNGSANSVNNEIEESAEREISNSINNHSESKEETASNCCPVDQNKSHNLRENVVEMNDKVT